MKVESEFGAIEFNMPDISDIFILLGQMGYDTKKIKNEDINEDFIFVGRMIKRLGPFIQKVNLKTKDDIAVDNYDEALKHFEFVDMMTKVASHITAAMQVDDKKKLSSKK